MKTALLILGILIFIYGLHWIGQGTGWLPWPAGTVMEVSALGYSTLITT